MRYEEEEKQPQGEKKMWRRRKLCFLGPFCFCLYIRPCAASRRRHLKTFFAFISSLHFIISLMAKKNPPCLSPLCGNGYQELKRKRKRVLISIKNSRIFDGFLLSLSSHAWCVSKKRRSDMRLDEPFIQSAKLTITVPNIGMNALVVMKSSQRTRKRVTSSELYQTSKEWHRLNSDIH